VETLYYSTPQVTLSQTRSASMLGRWWDFSPMCLACYDVTEVIGMKEFSFIIGNCPGSLVEIAEILGNEHVNIEGIAGACHLSCHRRSWEGA